MSKILFVAPASNLNVASEIIASLQGQRATPCVGTVDRAKLEQYLSGATQYDVVHFAGHGGQSVLQLSDGLLEVQDLLIMLEHQRQLKLVVVTACTSTRVGTEIHNARHIPTVMCQIDIDDPAAVRFSETFYRAYLATGNVERAVNVGRATLAKEFAAMADAVVVANGDMATPVQMAEFMATMKNELATMQAILDGLVTRIEHLEAVGELVPPTTWQMWLNMGLSLLASVLLIFLLLRPA